MGRGPAITQADIDKVLTVDAASLGLLSEREMCRITGRSNKTVAKIKARYEGVISAFRELKSREIVEDLDIVRRGYLAHIADPKNIQKCSSPQAAMVFGVLTDKLLLESGRPTQITLNANADVSLPDVLGRLKKAIEGRQATTSGSGQADNERL